MRRIVAPYSPRLFRHGGCSERQGEIHVDFSASINPLGTPPAAIAAVRAALNSLGSYPDPECRLLTRRLAELHRVDPSQIIVGNGSNDLIYLVVRALHPIRVAIVEPTYTEYLRASLLAGAEVDHWLPDAEDFQPKPFDPGPVSLVWLCHPNNPTGNLWEREECVSWIAMHPRTCFLVDEAFLPFLDNEGDLSLIPALARLPNLMVLRSLTKLYALPGLRVGYLVVPSGQDRKFRHHLVPWSVNVLAQEAALASLADPAFLKKTQEWLKGELPSFLRQLAGLGKDLDVFRSQVNFLLLRLKPGGMAAQNLTLLLAQRGVAVRDASTFIGLDDHFIRVAVRTAADNGCLVKEMRRIFGERTNTH